MFQTLKEIKATPVGGNAMSDMTLMEDIDWFVQDGNNSIEERAEALHFLSEDVMGCDSDRHRPDEEVVSEYMDNL